MQQGENNDKRRFPLALTIALATLAVLILASLIWCFYFQGRALARSYVGGVSISGLSETEAINRVKAANVPAPTLTVKGPEKSKTVDSTALSLKPDVESSVAAAFTKRSFFAPLWLGAHNYPLALTGDVPQAKLKKVFAEVSAKDQPAKDAQVALDEESKTFKVSAPAKTGKGTDFSQIEKAVTELAKTGAAQEVTVTASEIQPKLTTEKAEKWAKSASKLTTAPFQILVGQATIDIEAPELATFLVPAAKSENAEAKISDPAVKAWVDKTVEELQAEHAVPGRRTVDAKGNTLVEIVQPVIALTIADPTKAATNISAAASEIIAGKTVEFPINIEGTAAKPVWNDVKVGSTGYQNMPYQAGANERWIDVNLSTRQTTVFEGNTPIYGPATMVPGAPETPTVEGTFRVYLRRPLQTLVGKNVDGSEYRTPDVPWLLYFEGSYALHGAYWRSAWGFDAAYGSHGCVNLPLQVAKDIYDLSPIGTVVRVHR